MSEGIWYKGRLIGSVHYAHCYILRDGTLVREDNIFVRLDNWSTLETLVRLHPKSRLCVGENNKCHEMTYTKFRKGVLEKARAIRVEADSLDLSQTFFES